MKTWTLFYILSELFFEISIFGIWIYFALGCVQETSSRKVWKGQQAAINQIFPLTILNPHHLLPLHLLLTFSPPPPSSPPLSSPLPPFSPHPSSPSPPSSPTPSSSSSRKILLFPHQFNSLFLKSHPRIRLPDPYWLSNKIYSVSL